MSNLGSLGDGATDTFGVGMSSYNVAPHPAGIFYLVTGLDPVLPTATGRHLGAALSAGSEAPGTTAARFEHTEPGGIALELRGGLALSLSGSADMHPGQRSVTIFGPITPATRVVASFAGDPGNPAVIQYVKSGSGQADIVASHRVRQTTPVNFFIYEQGPPQGSP